MLRLRVTAIGSSCVEAGKDTTQRDLEALRARNAESMGTYHENLRSHSESKLGDSIVRDCSVHDTRHFTIERDISIYVSKTEKN
jgi:hypothetical protein